VSDAPEPPYSRPNAFNGVSCPSPAGSLCVAVGENGIFTSTDPTGGASAWTQVDGVGAHSDALSCPSASLCVVASGSYGELITSSDPTGGPGAWTSAKVDGENSIVGLSCPSESLCVGVDDAGNVLTSTDPAGGAGAWAITPVYPAGFGSISCPTRSFCAIVGGAGFTTSTDPTGGSSAWTLQQKAEGAQLEQVACASASLCIASGLNGEIAESSDPTGGEGEWVSTGAVDGTNGLTGVSCASESLCFVTDEALLIGIPARTLSVSLSGMGTVKNTPVACPFGCTYTGPACPRNCAGRPLTAYVSGRLESISCMESGLFGDANVGPCSTLFPGQDTVTLAATPAENWVFTGWGGACSAAASCSLAMSADRVVSATFSAVPQPTATVVQVLALTHVSQTHARWRKASGRSRSLSSKQHVPVGTTFSFDLNESASVTLSFSEHLAGRKLGKSCVAPSNETNMNHRCTRDLAAGTLIVAAHAGRNSVRFAGALASHGELKPGNYTLMLTANVSGKHSTPSQLHFTIERG
jgi:Divergent InlB B-repeat domain